VLDVHPPHTTVHGWRDFFVHIATITIGLLIALSLEGLVEWRHHRHLVAEARETIREEITENRHLLAEDIKTINSDRTQMLTDMETLRSMRGGHNQKDRSITLAWSWSAMNSSAWQTARDTGALSYLPYAEVQSLAEIYEQQQLVNTEASALIRQQVATRVPLLIEPQGAIFSDAELTEALHKAAETTNQIDLLHDLITSLERNYKESLDRSNP
jgi:hypothetical protein